jgi:YHS domain-containing protein
MHSASHQDCKTPIYEPFPGTHSALRGLPLTGDELIDLTCHDVVRVQRNTSRLQCGDDTFYFCSPFCRHRFAVALEAFVPLRDHNDQSVPETTVRQLKRTIEDMMHIQYAKRVELVPQEPGEFKFGCQMSVIRGKSIVE